MANELRVRQNFIGGLVDTVDLAGADTVVTDGTTTSGSATLGSATAAFTTADIGATVSGAGIPSNTTISAFISSTSVTMSANATATASSVSVTIGRSGNFHSTALAAVATVIGSTNHFPVTLDPDGIYGAPEIAYVTALTPVGATRATVARGKEGTTARTHLLDTPWVHSPTVNDFSPPMAKVTRQVSAQAFTTSQAAISWDTKVWDTDAMVDLVSHATRVTIQTPGKYQLTAEAVVPAFTGTEATLIVAVNGAPTTPIAQSNQAGLGASFGTLLGCSTDYQFVAGDYVEIYITLTASNNVGTSDVRTFLSIHSIGYRN